MEPTDAEGDSARSTVKRSHYSGAASADECWIAAPSKRLNNCWGAVPMEGNDRENLHPNTGGDQTSFGSQLNTSFENGNSSGTERKVEDLNTGRTDSKLEDVNTGSGVTRRVKRVASTVKDKAAGLPALLADGLEAGAEVLRKNRPSSASTTTGSSVAIAEDSSITAVTDTLASGMQSSAEWLRDADIDKLKQGVEKQVKEHPARSLLVALGAGYLIGKALRR